jgi:hypothetical protein
MKETVEFLDGGLQFTVYVDDVSKASIPDTIILKKTFYSLPIGRHLQLVSKATPERNAIIDAADSMRTRVSTALLRTVEAVKDVISLKDLAEKLQVADLNGVLQVLDLDKRFQAAAKGAGLQPNETSFLEAIKDTWAVGARAELDSLNKVPIRKDNPCHKPAGTNEGGQFCETGSGVSSGWSDEEHQSAANRWSAGLSLNEQDTVENYVMSQEGINRYLRTGVLMPPEWYSQSTRVDSEIAALDALTHSRGYVLPKTVDLYRGLSGEFAAEVKTMAPGTVFTDKGFVSASTKRGAALEFLEPAAPLKGVVIRIVVPKGVTVAPFTLSQSSYHEVLLPRNSSFRVVKNNEIQLVVELIPTSGVVHKKLVGLVDGMYIPGKTNPLVAGKRLRWEVGDIVVIEKPEAGISKASIPDTIGLALSFDLINPEAIAFLSTYVMELIKQVSDETRRAIADVVMNAFQYGGHPYEQARTIRNMIGLTQTQSQAVANFRRMLENEPLAALTRDLRDHRFDATLRMAGRMKGQLSKEQIDKMAQRYYDRYLKYRAEMIARTETIRASAMGQMETWRQAIAQGLLPQNMKRKWTVTYDDRLCSHCKSIPKLNPGGRGMDEQFISDIGAVDGPPLHPHCRCAVVKKVDWNA